MGFLVVGFVGLVFADVLLASGGRKKARRRNTASVLIISTK
jgi:hypothetical protein